MSTVFIAAIRNIEKDVLAGFIEHVRAPHRRCSDVQDVQESAEYIDHKVRVKTVRGHPSQPTLPSAGAHIFAPIVALTCGYSPILGVVRSSLSTVLLEDMTAEAEPCSEISPAILPVPGDPIPAMTNEPSWWQQNKTAILIELISAGMSAVLVEWWH